MILPRVLQTLYITTGCDYTSFFSITKVYQFPLHCRCMQGLVYHGQNTLYQRCHHRKHLQRSTSAGVLGEHQCSLGWTSLHFSYINGSLTHSPPLSYHVLCSIKLTAAVISSNCSYFISFLMFKVLLCILLFSRTVKYNVDFIVSLTKM